MLFLQKLVLAILAMATVIEASVPYPFFGHSFLPAYPAYPAYPAFSPVPALPPVSAFPVAPALPAVPAALPAVPAAFPVTPKFVRFAPPSVPPYAYSVNVVTRALTPPSPFVLPPFGVQAAQPLPAYNYWRR